MMDTFPSFTPLSPSGFALLKRAMTKYSSCPVRQGMSKLQTGVFLN